MVKKRKTRRKKRRVSRTRYREYLVEWLDWDYKHHYTKYVPRTDNVLNWSDKRQIRADVRGSCRKILQRSRA